MKQITLITISSPAHISERRQSTDRVASARLESFIDSEPLAGLEPLAPSESLQFHDRRIISCLDKLGLSIETCTQPDFIKNNFSEGIKNAYSSIVMFMSDRNHLMSEEFKSAYMQYRKKYPENINFCLMPFSCDIHDLDVIGTFDEFIYWPCSPNELNMRLLPYLRNKHTLILNNNEKKDELISRFSKLNLCGQSDNFLQVLELIEKIAKHQATVLIQGETGTGKENAARAVHYLGGRAECPFVPINCATIPDDLLESELFGHEKGAFTDAKQTKEGLIAFANGGTLFLDEVDSLSTKAQAALLRFLQTQEYRPVGSKKLLRANVRVVAATNADLKQLSIKKQFREDLYFRLNVLSLTMPPLRERQLDLPVIAENLVKRFAKEYDLPIKLLSQQSLGYLQQQDWPGNVREFENTLLRSFLFSTGKYLDIYQEQKMEMGSTAVNKAIGDNHIINDTPKSFQDAKANAIECFEKSYLSQVMVMTNGNVTLAAKIAGKERRALGKLLQKYQIDRYQYREAN